MAYSVTQSLRWWDWNLTGMDLDNWLSELHLLAPLSIVVTSVITGVVQPGKDESSGRLYYSLSLFNESL